MPSLCPNCHSPDLPFGGESVCDCPGDPDDDPLDDNEPSEPCPEGTYCLYCGSPWGVVWGFCDNCDPPDDDGY